MRAREARSSSSCRLRCVMSAKSAMWLTTSPVASRIGAAEISTSMYAPSLRTRLLSTTV